ncbi:hypothetical protein JCM6882_009695 [Rhodosporidiobolus microsporus]
MASPQQQQSGTTSSAPTYPPPPPAVPPTPHPLAVLEPYRPTTSGAVWRRSRLSIVSLVGATVILVTWIVAAVWLYAIDFFLPLDFFGGLEDPTGENGEGFFHWSNRMYNNLITLLGTLSWVVISYALAVGFTTILRREFVKEDGVSLSTFEALVKLSSQSLQLKFRWSAIVALVVFAVAQLYPTATQAAFGSTFAHVNISTPYTFARISSNLPLISHNMSLGRSTAISRLEEPNDNLLRLTLTHLFNASDAVEVGGTLELSDRGQPLFDAIHLGADTQVTIGDYLSTAEHELVSSSPSLSVNTTVEGFFANVSCALRTVQFDRIGLRNGSFFNYELFFPCGAAGAFYAAGGSPSRVNLNMTVVDYFACPGKNSSTLYIFTAGVGDAPFIRAFECNLSTSSTLVSMVAATHRSKSSGDILGEPPTDAVEPLDFRVATVTRIHHDTRVDVPPSFGLLQYLGDGPLRTIGMFGADFLAMMLKRLGPLGPEGGTEQQRQCLEHHLETVAKHKLVQLGWVLDNFFRLGQRSMSTQSVARTLQVDALQLHLSNLAWLAVPIVLLIAVLLIFPLFLTTTGMVDFTDPLSANLIALNSPPDPYVYGACTGDFPDDLSQATTGGKSKARAVKLRYGKYEWAQRGPPPHLVMAADPAVKAGLDAPVRGKEYA